MPVTRGKRNAGQEEEEGEEEQKEERESSNATDAEPEVPSMKDSPLGEEDDRLGHQKPGADLTELASTSDARSDVKGKHPRRGRRVMRRANGSPLKKSSISTESERTGESAGASQKTSTPSETTLPTRHGPRLLSRSRSVSAPAITSSGLQRRDSTEERVEPASSSVRRISLQRLQPRGTSRPAGVPAARSQPVVPDARRDSGSDVAPNALAAMRHSSQQLEEKQAVAQAVRAAAIAAGAPRGGRKLSDSRSVRCLRSEGEATLSWNRLRNACLGTLCVTMTAALLFAFMNSFLGKRDDGGTPLCNTHACLQYARRLLASLNHSVDPCQNFTRFVCDGWRSKEPLSVREESFRGVITHITRIARLINVPEAGQSMLARGARIYESCQAVLNGHSDQLPLVKAALRAAGVTWPHPLPPAERRDLLHMMFYCDYVLGWSSVFRVDTELSNGSTKVYVLTDSGFNFLVRKHRESRCERSDREYFHLLLEFFMDERTEEVGVAQPDNVTYEATMALEAKMFEPLVTNFDKNWSFSVEVPATVVYNDKANLSRDRWLEVFHKHRVNLAGEVEFRTWNLAFFTTFVDLLVRYGEADMYAYASWSTVQVAALFARRELIQNFYGDDSRAGIFHGAFCLGRAYIGASKALLSRYANEVLPKESRLVVERLTVNFRASLRKRMASWADNNESVDVLESWEKSGFPFSIFEPEEANNVTNVVIGDMGDSFVKNWHYAWQSRTHNRPLDMKVAISAIETIKYVADVDDRKDFVLLPYLFSFPLYDRELLSAINYGGVGAHVAKAIGERFYTSYRNASAHSFSQFQDCLLNGSLVIDQSQKASFFAEVVSLGTLVDLYRNATDDRRLPGLEHMTDEQLLFAAICYSKCIGRYYDDADALCNEVLAHVPQFAEAYQCHEGSPMNPHEKCTLF